MSQRQRRQLGLLMLQVGHCLLAAWWDRPELRWEPVAVTYARCVEKGGPGWGTWAVGD